MSQLDAAASRCLSSIVATVPDAAYPELGGRSAPNFPTHHETVPGHDDEAATSESRRTVLWIDDEPDHALSALLNEYGCQIEWATTGAAGLERHGASAYDAIVVDVRLGDMSGLTVVRRIKALDTATPVLVVTGCYCEEEVLQDAWRLGAAAVAYKPFLDEQELAAALRVIIDGRGRSLLLHVRPDDLGGPLQAGAGRGGAPDDLTPAAMASPGFVAVSPAMRAVVDWIAHVAPTEGTILLTGETGVGKQLVAEAIHRSSRRRDRPFVTLNCASIPEGLIESELFGHRKGAFTGAASDQPGVVKRAHRGTLFLDEIGDVPLAMQGHLLRFLETGEARRLGEVKAVRFDVRIIAATNRELSEAVARGQFRQDLYFRLAVLHRCIPPLRERRDDVDALVATWLPRLAERHHHRELGITREALAALRACQWPGNVRELRNVLERAVCLASGERLTLADMTTALVPVSAAGVPDGKRGVDIDATLKALHDHRGNRTETARALGIDRTTLWRRLRRYGFGRHADDG